MLLFLNSIFSKNPSLIFFSRSSFFIGISGQGGISNIPSFQNDQPSPVKVCLISSGSMFLRNNCGGMPTIFFLNKKPIPRLLGTLMKMIFLAILFAWRAKSAKLGINQVAAKFQIRSTDAGFRFRLSGGLSITVTGQLRT